MSKVTQAHIDARTQDILDAARRMFVRKGVDAATVQEIASEAGLSAGAIYRYYGSKSDLLRAVCGDWVAKDRELFERASVESDSPLQALLRVGQHVWDDMKEPDAREDTLLALEATLEAERHSPELAAERRTAMREVVGMLERTIRKAQDAGEIDRSVDERALANMLMACSFGTRLLALEMKDDINTDDVLGVLGVMLSRFGPEEG
jgi:TetR/AcrR family transcriptional regulator, transcriptional repressor of aconitase